MEIVRRDFPPSADGYDRAAVDAHLEAIAAAVSGRPGPAVPAEQVVSAGRELLGQISRLRVELKNVSAALREQGVTISDALEELLDLGPGPDAAAVGPDAAPVASAAGIEPGPGPAAVDRSPESASAPAAASLEPAPGPAEPSPASARVPAPAPSVAAAPVPAPAPAVPAAPSTAVEDARLVALDMALDGRSRAEIERELARFDLPDRAAVVDSVLAAIG